MFKTMPNIESTLKKTPKTLTFYPTLRNFWKSGHTAKVSQIKIDYILSIAKIQILFEETDSFGTFEECNTGLVSSKNHHEAQSART